MKNAAIIGAGFGGLTASILLANKGFDVHVYEQNPSPGGKAGNINENGFRFDSGPSLLTMPFVLNDIIEEAGENITDYLELKKSDVLCKYFFNDKTVLTAYSDNLKFAEEIESKTEDSSESVLRYLKYCRRIYELTSDIFLFNNPRNIRSYLNTKAVNSLINLKNIDAFRTMHEANSSFFKDKRTIQLFDRYATYNGSSPFKAPATLNTIQHVEYNLGGYIADGGIYSIVEAIYKIALKKNVKFNFNSPVEKIIIENNSVTGIWINNSDLLFDAVISNVDVHTTYTKLLKINQPINSKDLSSSALVFYWGIIDTFDMLEVHNILFSEDYKKEFDDIFEKRICPEDPTVYIYISSKFNKNDSPEDCENWFVMINVPFIDNQNWEEEIKKSRERIINRIKASLNINIKEKIIFEKILTPQILFERTGSYKGSIYGLSSNSKYSSFVRHPAKSKRFNGLYFCGGSVHPGGGIPLAVLSGKNAANYVVKDLC